MIHYIYKLSSKAFFGSKHAIKVLMQKNSSLGRVCCYSPFQSKNPYCKIVRNYFSTNLAKSEAFFIRNSKHNPSVLFLYYNFIKKHLHTEKVELLDAYFSSKSLTVLSKLDDNKALYVDNVKTAELPKCNIGDEKVSVIITVHNCDSLVYDAVMSIVNQTYENIEVIVVDDGSTDNTPSVLKQLRDTYPSIKLFSIQNSGTYIARNVGLLHARGDYITFHDADDWAHPQRVCEHIQAHKSHSNCSATLSLMARITPDGYFYSKQIYPVDRNCMVSLMFSRTTFQKLGFFKQGRIGNDSEYFERIKNFCEGEIGTIDKVLTICAQRPNSLTTTLETSNEIGKNQKRMHQMKRWRRWHKLYKSRSKVPYVSFNINKIEVKELI